MFCLQNKFIRLLSLQAKLVIFLTVVSINFTYAANHNKSKQQTLNIKSQYLLLNEKKGISKYKGNVLFTKNTLTIKADTITLYYDGKKLTKALITGSPADVQHQPDNEAKVHSQANSMEYFITEDQLILKGQAFVIQGDRHFSGEYIEYDTRQRTITAAGEQSSTISKENLKNNQPRARVHVIIGPDNIIENNKIK